jgi:hypothetical protein
VSRNYAIRRFRQSSTFYVLQFSAKNSHPLTAATATAIDRGRRQRHAADTPDSTETARTQPCADRPVGEIGRAECWRDLADLVADAAVVAVLYGSVGVAGRGLCAAAGPILG